MTIRMMRITLKRRKEVFGSSIDKMRSLIPKAIERLEEEINTDNGWKIALEILKISDIKSGYISNIGHDDAKKLIREEAEKRSTDEMLSLIDDSSIDELLSENKRKMETIQY